MSGGRRVHPENSAVRTRYTWQVPRFFAGLKETRACRICFSTPDDTEYANPAISAVPVRILLKLVTVFVEDARSTFPLPNSTQSVIELRSNGDRSQKISVRTVACSNNSRPPPTVCMRGFFPGYLRRIPVCQTSATAKH